MSSQVTLLREATRSVSITPPEEPKSSGLSSRKPAEGQVIHWVGRVTDEVFSFLGPATRALADSGVHQTVVALNDATCLRLMPGFPDGIDLVLVKSSANPLSHWRRSIATVRGLLRSGPIKALHLHGFLPSFAGSLATRGTGFEVPLIYSPHGSKSLSSMRGLGVLLKRVGEPVLATPRRQRAIANMALDARILKTMTQQSVELIESPVDAVFLRSKPSPTADPLLLGGSRLPNPRSAELAAQLAVLLNDESLRLSFHWMGPVDDASKQQLRAASVKVFEDQQPETRATRLASGWMYLALMGTRGFPLFLVEAMASGLPCLAIDTPYHRDLIRHGETGFLWSTQEELLSLIAQLIDSSELRSRIGDAAREEARARFNPDRFRDSLISAYESIAD